jgi:ubiquinone/menaquinone biosynthesis C-methylase UbiE
LPRWGRNLSKAKVKGHKSKGVSQKSKAVRRDGHEGWDDYAQFYDWENARTLGRRDVPFWRNFALRRGGAVLELGCGTGRIAVPLARAGVRLVGIDRSAPMLDRARRRVRRDRLTRRVDLIRGDIRDLPLQRGQFSTVIAPYGILQSLLRERDLVAALLASYEVLEPGGAFGLELVADLPSWQEYRKRVSLTGWRTRPGGSRVTLVETVRQDRSRRLTIFDQVFTERRGARRAVRRFALTFRTLSVPQMARRLEKVGFEVTALLGDYRGSPWDPRADVWEILAKRPET